MPRGNMMLPNILYFEISAQPFIAKRQLLTFISFLVPAIFIMLMILSAMQAIDPGLYEAAVVDGANGPQQVFFITIPSIKNTLLTLGMFDFVTTAAYFDLTWIMTQGGPVNTSEIIPTWVYRTAFQSFEFGKASAIGMILFTISVIVSIIVLRAMDKE